MSTTTARSCPVCRGTGTAYLEHTDGSLSQQPCPYCQGKKDQAWVAQAHRARYTRWKAGRVISGLALLGWLAAIGPLSQVLFSNQMGGGFAILGIVLWIATIFWAVSWIGGRPTKARKPDPMTSDQEKLMGAALLGAVVLKADLESRKHRK